MGPDEELVRYAKPDDTWLDRLPSTEGHNVKTDTVVIDEPAELEARAKQRARDLVGAEIEAEVRAKVAAEIQTYWEESGGSPIYGKALMEAAEIARGEAP